MSVLEDMEDSVNHMINMARRLTEMQSDDMLAETHAKLSEMTTRLQVQLDQVRKKMAEMGMEEPAVGEAEPGSPSSRQAPAQTPEDVLSSPLAGEEPRYARQHLGHPDPIERAAESPPSVLAGKTSSDDSRPSAQPKMKDQADKSSDGKSDSKTK